jgi:hypothetical protein
MKAVTSYFVCVIDSMRKMSDKKHKINEFFKPVESVKRSKSSPEKVQNLIINNSPSKASIPTPVKHESLSSVEQETNPSPTKQQVKIEYFFD